MSKIGIVRDSISVNKPVKLEYINKITVTVNKIQIHYTAGNFNSPNNSEVVILLVNPDASSYTAAYIRERVLKWISDGLASTSALILNDYLGKIVPTQVGVVGNQTTGQIISAVDSAAACAATPNIAVAVDTSSNAAPLVGTGIYLTNGLIPTGPVAAGNYALLLGSTQYFITVNNVSNISFIEICPLLLDFVYNLRNLTRTITEPNPDAISFSIRGFVPTSGQNYETFYGIQGLTSNPSPGQACSNNTSGIYQSGNSMWPVGTVNNALFNAPNFANEDVAFGLQLNNSNVADFSSAQLYISFDLNANAGVVADATFVPFVLPFGQNPVFPASPGGGIPGLGNGTTQFDAGNTNPSFSLNDMFDGTVFLPAGQSLVGTANFTAGAFAQFDSNQGNIQGVFNNTCLS